MSNPKIRGKDLDRINYKSSISKSIAIQVMAKHFKFHTKEKKLSILEGVKANPQNYIDDQVLAPVAKLFLDSEKEIPEVNEVVELNPKPFKVYGRNIITQKTIDQMDVAMSLPIAEKGALMPDAHVGYGLPIGGVLATKNEIIPYGVGLDIGCRMSLTICREGNRFLERYRYNAKKALSENCHFGIMKNSSKINDHEVLERSEFQETELLRRFHRKAMSQLGTSGSGNHFVEIGIVEMIENNQLAIPPGEYLGILSHSGSRGLGAAIANFYTRIANEKCHLPKGARNLGWLDLDSEAGIEYWRAMNLAGDYARACHDIIHSKMIKSLGVSAIHKVENHHNFAWKELQESGDELIVHRKGATPAKSGELGFIPANMLDPGWIVSGLGEGLSLNSASHGAGRTMSRSAAKSSIHKKDFKAKLKKGRVELIGGGVDEAPNAYKNLDDVMEHQEELVKKEGKFYPKIVRMDKA